jgi:hypothetical protein
MEAETALLKLDLPLEERRKLHSYYLKLREEHRKAMQTPGSSDTENKAE